MRMEPKGGKLGRMVAKAFSGESMFQDTYTAQDDRNKIRGIGSCSIYTAAIRIVEIMNR